MARTLAALAVVLLAPCVTWAFVPSSVSVAKVAKMSNSVGSMRPVSIARPARMTPEEEAEEREVQEELQRKIRGLYNAEGKPYAPWLLKQVNLEASARAIRARRAREKEALEKTGAYNDPQGQENFGVGLKYRVLNDKDVELGWVTGQEKDNLGFVVLRRNADETGDDFIELESFKTYPPLNSKGAEGGTYTYIDSDVDPGQYLYRVVDQDKKGGRSVLCQVGVEVQSSSDKIKNLVLVGGFAALIIGGAIASVFVDNVS